MSDKKTFTLTKKITKYSKQSGMVIPQFLASELKPRAIVDIRINVINEADEEEHGKNIN